MTKKCQNCGRPSGDKSRCPKCMEYCKTSQKRRRADFEANGECVKCGMPNPADTKTCPACLERQKGYQRKIRVDCIKAYGGKCECCGEDRMEFLHIDHVEGDGHIERASAKQRGLPLTIYGRLKKQGYPAGFRVLCANCNMSLAFYGYCPHHAPPEERLFD